MNKNYFLNLFLKEDEFLAATLWEDILLCLDIDFPVYTTVFVPPQFWSKINEVSNSLNIKTNTFGLTKSSEKKMISFSPINIQDNLEPPIVYFKISAPNKFKVLQHKDFLGSIMSLGLKREVLGDIIVENNIGYCVAFSDIFEIIEKNLNQINTLPIKIEKINPKDIPEVKFKEIIDTVSSYRIDSLISLLANVSRSSAVELIESGDVLVNYMIEKSKNKSILPGSVISIKKKGKFIFEKELGETKKGKFKILIKQYI